MLLADRMQRQRTLPEIRAVRRCMAERAQGRRCKAARRDCGQGAGPSRPGPNGQGEEAPARPPKGSKGVIYINPLWNLILTGFNVSCLGTAGSEWGPFRRWYFDRGGFYWLLGGGWAVLIMWAAIIVSMA